MSKPIFFCAGISGTVDAPYEQMDGLLLPTSVIAGKEKSVENLLDGCNPKYFMMDSGGFQLLMAENKKIITFDSTKPIKFGETINISPFHILETACNIKPDIFIGLDFPLQKKPVNGDYYAEFKKKAIFNIESAVKTCNYQNKFCPDSSFLLPIQAFTIGQAYYLLKKMKNLKFDGVCMPTRTLKPHEISKFLFHFHEIGIRNIHLLGDAKPLVLALAAYFGTHFLEWISLDSTTASTAAKYQSYLNPYDLSNVNISSKVYVDTGIKNDCPCPFCRNKTFTQIMLTNYTEKYYFLLSHNFWVITKFLSDAYENAGDLLSLKNFLYSRLKPKSFKKIIDELFGSLAVFDIPQK